MSELNLPTDQQVFEFIAAIAKEMGIDKNYHKDIEWLFDNISKNDRHKHPRFQEMIYWLKVAITRKI